MYALLINSLSRGGAEKIAINLATHLQSKNYNVLLICLVNRVDYELPKGLPIEFLSRKKNYQRGFGWQKFYYLPFMITRLLQIIKKYEIKIIQSHLYSSSFINVLTKKMGGKQEIHIVNHMHIDYEKKKVIAGFIKMSMLRYTYNRANTIVSISEKMKLDINRSILRNNSVFHTVIYNPHDIQAIQEKSKENIVDFKFKKNTKYIITAGRLVDRKKTDVLIKAFSKVISDINVACELLILGDGPERDKLQKLILDLNLDEKVHFLGFVTNPFKYISHANIFILASESEGLPNAIIEAMICKIPVISTDCPTGPREIIAPKTNVGYQLKNNIEVTEFGILVPVNNIDFLILGILKLFEDSLLGISMVDNAFRHVQQFSIGNISNKYKQILTKKSE